MQSEAKTPEPSAPEVAALFAAARAQHRAGQLAAAHALYRQTLAADPDHLGSLYFLGILAIETGRPADAIDVLTRVVARREAPDAHYHLALALQAERRLDTAETHYRKAVAIKPDYAEAHMNLGNVLAEQGRRLDAAHNNLGVMAAARGALPEAIAHYRRAVAARPGFVEAHNNLGLAFARRGDADAAVASLRHALALRPGHLDTTHHLARVLFAHGKAAAAVALLTAAIDRDGNAETRSLFVLCLRGLAPDELDGVRDYVLRALAEGWAHNGELEGPGIALVKRARAMAACIALANAAFVAGTMADLAQLLA
jgi:protein O-GlcNAc transferase